MSIAVPTALRRWLVPTSAALAVIGGGVAIGLVTSAADSSLPARSPQDLLADVLTARPEGLQGTIAVRADLGLPPLPLPTPGSADLSALASGTHTLRVWYSSPDQARLALLGQEGETDIVTDGTELWVWSSRENTALHTTLPEGGLAGILAGGMLGGGPADFGWTGGPEGTPSALPSGFGLTPDMIARLLITLLEPTTDITTDTDASVAGRAAYELVLRPTDTATLIESIVIDIDATEHFPLRVAINARDGGLPALEVAFTEISFTRPDPAQFTFNPPPGTEVVEAPPIGTTGGLDPDWPEPVAPDGTPVVPDVPSGVDGPGFAIVGSGWTTVLVARLPELPDGASADGAADDPGSSLAELLDALPPVSGDWGSGRLLSTRLFSVLLTDDGRVLVGAVDPERLYAAAVDPAAQLD